MFENVATVTKQQENRTNWKKKENGSHDFAGKAC